MNGTKETFGESEDAHAGTGAGKESRCHDHTANKKHRILYRRGKLFEAGTGGMDADPEQSAVRH
ncbi:hypothetical protein PIPA1_32250 [Pelosinus sp. IPA-1]|nr:hypothetical protein PIPA1_32250 [Pelosinus sp. IPA-1]